LKAVVLLSGGLDSVVNFKCALDHGGIELALTFDYGQAAFANERYAAAACAERFGVAHRIIELDWYRDLVPGAISGDGDVQTHETCLPSDADRLLREAWIPNRNCVFTSIGAVFAESLGAGQVVIGLNREEGEVFPDNSGTFLRSIDRVLATSTLSGVRAVSYTEEMSKADIVGLGRQIGAPLDVVYSCYRRSGDHSMCGTCQSCVRLKDALAANGISDILAARFIE
jgi:7-cyano-7-deazaguanine synthase